MELPEPDERHCDDYIDDPTQPECLRRYLRWQRWPADWECRARAYWEDKGWPIPALFALYKGPGGAKRRVRVVMASRLGDVGISKDLTADHGYWKRVSVESLSNYSDTP